MFPLEILNPAKLALKIKDNTWLGHITACADCLCCGFGKPILRGTWFTVACVHSLSLRQPGRVSTAQIRSWQWPGVKYRKHSAHTPVLRYQDPGEGGVREISKTDPVSTTLQSVSRNSPEGLSALREGHRCPPTSCALVGG